MHRTSESPLPKRLTRGSLFSTGTLVRHREYGLVSLWRGHPIGELVVSSGELVVADAHSLSDTEPLTIEVPRGMCRVWVGTHEMDAGHDVTGLCVRFGPARIKTWRSLLPRGKRLGIDGAAVAICDAVARPAPVGSAHERYIHRLASIGGDLGGEVLDKGKRSIAACRIGSDGGYPIMGGFDDAGGLVAIAVTTLSPGESARWPDPDATVPPVDATDLDACIAWAIAVGEDEPIVRPGSLDDATREALVSIAGRPMPAELARYYSLCTPWVGEGAGLAMHRASIEKNRLVGAFPVALDREDSLVVALPTKLVSLYQGSTMGTFIDLRAWALLSTIAVHDLSGR